MASPLTTPSHAFFLVWIPKNCTNVFSKDRITPVDSSGAVVTLDAMHCQTKTAQKIQEKHADYILADYILTVKKNQPALQKIIRELFEVYGEDGYRDKKVRICKTSEKNRGREEIRMYTVAPAPGELGKRGWGDAQSVGMVYRVRQIALSMLKRNSTIKSSLRGKRFMAGWNTDLLEEILTGK